MKQRGWETGLAGRDREIGEGGRDLPKRGVATITVDKNKRRSREGGRQGPTGRDRQIGEGGGQREWDAKSPCKRSNGGERMPGQATMD